MVVTTKNDCLVIISSVSELIRGSSSYQVFDFNQNNKRNYFIIYTFLHAFYYTLTYILLSYVFIILLYIYISSNISESQINYWYDIPSLSLSHYLALVTAGSVAQSLSLSVSCSVHVSSKPKIRTQLSTLSTHFRLGLPSGLFPVTDT